MITPQTVPAISGAAPAFAAPAASDKTEVGAVLIVKNGSAAAVTVTLVTPGNLDTGDAYPDKTYSVPAGGEFWIPVLAVYRGTDGLAAVNFSAVASVTVAAVRLK